MQFIVIAQDYAGKDALARRLAAREAHIALSDKAILSGEQIFGVAMLDAEGNMCGSVMIVNFPARSDVDKWLEQEPYVTGKVWEKIEVRPCKVGPSFIKSK